jgi:hypothetical protein
MDFTTMLVGVALVAYGLVTTWIRRTAPNKFRKLGPMKEFWGERGGFWIHVVGYSLLPIILGIILIFRGTRGLSIFF